MTRIECLQILELPATATRADIIKAYRQLGIVWHPDRFGNDAELQRKARDKLSAIEQAYVELIGSNTEVVADAEPDEVSATCEISTPQRTADLQADRGLVVPTTGTDLNKVNFEEGQSPIIPSVEDNAGHRKSMPRRKEYVTPRVCEVCRDELTQSDIDLAVLGDKKWREKYRDAWEQQDLLEREENLKRLADETDPVQRELLENDIECWDGLTEESYDDLSVKPRSPGLCEDCRSRLESWEGELDEDEIQCSECSRRLKERDFIRIFRNRGRFGTSGLGRKLDDDVTADAKFLCHSCVVVARELENPRLRPMTIGQHMDQLLDGKQGCASVLALLAIVVTLAATVMLPAIVDTVGTSEVSIGARINS